MNDEVFTKEIEDLFSALENLFKSFHKHQDSLAVFLTALKDTAKKHHDMGQPIHINHDAIAQFVKQNLDTMNKVADLGKAAHKVLDLPDRMEGRKLAKQLGLNTNPTDKPEEG